MDSTGADWIAFQGMDWNEPEGKCLDKNGSELNRVDWIG